MMNELTILFTDLMEGIARLLTWLVSGISEESLGILNAYEYYSTYNDIIGFLNTPLGTILVIIVIAVVLIAVINFIVSVIDIICYTIKLAFLTVMKKNK